MVPDCKQPNRKPTAVALEGRWQHRCLGYSRGLLVQWPAFGLESAASGRVVGSMANNNVGRFLTDLGTMTSRPWAFLVVLVYGVLWFAFSRETLDLHGITTLIVWTMTLFIQRAQHRDTQALHAKLDELLRVEGGAARSDLARIDDEEPEQIERHRKDTRGTTLGRPPHHATSGIE
jgi:low affinity Fe/Cu permease